ncbi:EamA family transporter [Ahrensia marina]|uniref:EamA family transporter n=1 Tax=Ahrensia marina TaxID=1514904 RepID=UPI0035CF5432
MTIKHMALALLVAAIWGIAFTVIRLGLDVVSPLLLTALRFVFAAFPLLLFLRPPKAPWHIVVAYGVIQGAIMFGLVFHAISIGMPAGLASLVVQCQVFFTVGLAALFDGERPKRHHFLAAGIAALGIFVIALAKTDGQTVPLWPLILTVMAAFAWGMANIVSRRAKSADPVSFVVWSSAAAPPLLVAGSLVLEPGALNALMGLRGVDLWTLTWTTMALAVPTTILAFAIWVWLLRTYQAAIVMPFALLVPIFGFGGAALFLGERWSLGIGVGAVLVLAGLAINVLGDRRIAASSS